MVRNYKNLPCLLTLLNYNNNNNDIGTKSLSSTCIKLSKHQ